MLGCWDGEVGRWYQRLRGCTCNLAEDEVAGWDNYSWVWMYREGQGHLFTPSTYFDWSKVRNIPLNSLFLPDFPWHHRAEIVCWVSENKWPFKIVTNPGFCSLMKTGQPNYHLPSAETTSCDAWVVFINVRKHIVKMLQVSSIIIIPRYKHTFKTAAGTCRGAELCNRCMDVPQPQGICGHYSTFRKQRRPHGNASWHCGSCALAFRP